MSQSLALHIRGCPDHSPAHWSALRLIRAWQASGRSIHSVFFSGAAALIGQRLRFTPQGQMNLQAQWQTLECPLIICVNAAYRCGILSEIDAAKQQLAAPTTAEGFSIGGLGTLAEAKLEADQLVEFP